MGVTTDNNNYAVQLMISEVHAPQVSSSQSQVIPGCGRPLWFVLCPGGSNTAQLCSTCSTQVSTLVPPGAARCTQRREPFCPMCSFSCQQYSICQRQGSRPAQTVGDPLVSCIRIQWILFSSSFMLCCQCVLLLGDDVPVLNQLSPS